MIKGSFVNTMEYFRAYSLLFAAAVLLVPIAIILIRSKARPPVMVAFISLVVGLTLVYFYARPVQTPLLGDSSQIQARIGKGKPVLLEFQSPYCITCTVLKPAVDKAEKEYGKRLVIMRINIQDPLGVELKSVYNYQYTPTFIFIDKQGQERWRTIGDFNEAQLRAEMNKEAQ